MLSVSKCIVIAIFILSLIPISSALNITASVGETWIIYRWEANRSTNVYIDGVRQATNSNFRDYYLTDLNPDEKHQIRLYNATNTTELLGSVTVTTLHSRNIIYILICVLIIFFIILLLLKDPLKLILIGGVAAAISLYTSQISLGYGALVILPLITLIISSIFIIYALWTITIEKTRW